jgi:hypothetical protein
VAAIEPSRASTDGGSELAAAKTTQSKMNLTRGEHEQHGLRTRGIRNATGCEPSGTKQNTLVLAERLCWQKPDWWKIKAGEWDLTRETRNRSTSRIGAKENWPGTEGGFMLVGNRNKCRARGGGNETDDNVVAKWKWGPTSHARAKIRRRLTFCVTRKTTQKKKSPVAETEAGGSKRKLKSTGDSMKSMSYLGAAHHKTNENGDETHKWKSEFLLHKNHMRFTSGTQR